MSQDIDLETPEDTFAEQCEAARKALHFHRTQEAAEIVRQLVEESPDSTTAHELMGDVLVAQGKRSGAKDEYKKALELEPANADAERKFAEATLLTGQMDRTHEMLESGDFEGLRGASHKDPGAAALRSVFFPGLGQLYNGEYEKGVIAALLGLPLFGMALWGIMQVTMSMMPNSDSATNRDIVLGVFGLVGYSVLLTWSAWDAHATAKRGDNIVT